ncbi:glyoxalase [Actinoplanes sp. OR16]|uniref:VOC family protein n=1 Tax=Actinoplanes sp. OR16 TaxID=946334 RepID=UPI000F705758|nr:VOC family protein [Actinoplanes sp. OR16]BBH68716.1 glyoxalase [Actinoplanes sp. OR16]
MFQRLHHVCVVVADLGRAVAYYESLGVGPFFDYPKGTAYIEFDVPNPAASAAMRYKCADLDNFQLQLCQPGDLDSPQKRFLDSRGEGVYHLGFEVADLLTAQNAGAELGLGVIARGLRADGTGFCYFDTRDDAGVVLEVRR